MNPRIKTKAYTYLLPTLSDEVLDIKSNLINVFLYDESKPELRDHLFLLYKFSASDAFLRFEEEVTWSVYYESKYDADKTHVMIVFRRPEYWKEDTDLILASKFSETSKRFKAHVVKFHELPAFSQIVGVLYKKEFAFKAMDKLINEGLPVEHWTLVPRDQEASGLLSMKLETYTEKHKVKDVLATANNFLDERKD